jgi:HSP20 family protein
MNALAPWRSRLTFSPWQEIEDLQERLDRMLGRGWPGFTTEEISEWTPAVNLEERDNEFVLTAELPGIEEKDVDIELDQNVLTVKGEKRTEREEKKEKNGHWHMVERSHGVFQRSFTLPPSVDPAKIKAEFKDGVLTIHLAKREGTTARRIAIGGK